MTMDLLALEHVRNVFLLCIRPLHACACAGGRRCCWLVPGAGGGNMDQYEIYATCQRQGLCSASEAL
eukprot:scaffold14575_cov137-Isochrysis_galbana.AAC.2